MFFNYTFKCVISQKQYEQGATNKSLLGHPIATSLIAIQTPNFLPIYSLFILNQTVL